MTIQSFITRRLAAASIVLIVSQLAVQVRGQYVNTTFDTKGIPLQGVINGANGNVIATKRYFGEGTDNLLFDSSGQLMLKDAHGKVIAGFEVEATTLVLPLQGLHLPGRNGGRDIDFAQHYEKVTFRKGILTITAPQTALDSNWGDDFKDFTLAFKKVEQYTLPTGQVVNRLVLVSDAACARAATAVPPCEEFVFTIEPAASLYHTLSPVKGDVAGYFKRQEASRKPARGR